MNFALNYDSDLIPGGPFTLQQNVHFSGSIFWNIFPTPTTLDWGSPGWNHSEFRVSTTRFDLAPKISSHIEFGPSWDIDIFGFHFDIDPTPFVISPDFSQINVPQGPGEFEPHEVVPGPGPWSGIVDVLGSLDFSLSAFGVLELDNIPLEVERLVAELSRLPAGSMYSLGLLSLPDSVSLTNPIVDQYPGCENSVTLIITVCALDVLNITATPVGPFQVSNFRSTVVGADSAVGTSSADIRASSTGSIPEPATLALIGIGLAGLGFSRRKFAVS